MGPQRTLPMHRRIQTAPPEANILTTVSTSSASFFLPMEVICRERRKVRHEVYCFLLSINTSLRLVLIFFFSSHRFLIRRYYLRPCLLFTFFTILTFVTIIMFVWLLRHVTQYQCDVTSLLSADNKWLNTWHDKNKEGWYDTWTNCHIQLKWSKWFYGDEWRKGTGNSGPNGHDCHIATSGAQMTNDVRVIQGV